MVDTTMSVCSGIGGLDIGFSRGLSRFGRESRTVCMVEREAYCFSILAKQMQKGLLDKSPIWMGDLKDLPIEQLPSIKWYIGGYPCQPFSSAGKRLGEKDPRHLWPIIREQVRRIKPMGVFFENVSNHANIGMSTVLQELAEVGYSCSWGFFSAQEVGAPHKRERIFIQGLADNYIGRLKEQWENYLSIRKNESGDDSCGRSENLANCNIERLEGYSGNVNKEGRKREWKSGHAAKSSVFLWPAKPGEDQYEHEPPRTIESRLCRNSNGVSSRVDRLRALGNACCPQQAEFAFVSLFKENLNRD